MSTLHSPHLVLIKLQYLTMRSSRPLSAYFFFILASFILISIPTCFCTAESENQKYAANCYKPFHFLCASARTLYPRKLGSVAHVSYARGGFSASAPSSRYQVVSNKPRTVGSPAPSSGSSAPPPAKTSTAPSPRQIPVPDLAPNILIQYYAPTPVPTFPDYVPTRGGGYYPSEHTANWRLILGIGMAAILIVSLGVVCSVKRGYLSCHAILWWKRDAMNDRIGAEEMIKNYRSIAPKLYTYSDVKKLTNSFKDKVGQGGFGVVYKGKLPDGDGRIVAVKVLSAGKGHGEEFINEVASISRTSHVNIVNLLGFCYERNKRALIYEFVSNGSLDKFIYDQGTSVANCHLDSRTMFQIAVGVARGLEYLHRGCQKRILHFDIKPHNILLDEDLCPKISDFGLAKLCKTKESIVSMTGMRGTPGFIAPEVFNRNFGGVSHKSDVYSYGMLILEMVGGRKNFQSGVSHTSQIYFPHWIYNKLQQKQSFVDTFGDITEVEEDMIKKLIIISLWCIQTNPSDRPSMAKVIEMLEGTILSLQFPPKPFLDSPTRSP